MPESENKKSHFLLGDISETEQFSPPRLRIDTPNIPQPNRHQHGSRLLGNIETIRSLMDEARIIQQNAGLDEGLGLQVEFESIPEVELAFESLARDNSGIELLNVRKSENKTLATVIQDSNAWSEYPSSNTTDGIHDPGQAWNALTIGAFTNLVDIAEDDAENYQPIAPAGGLSPFSTTSATWEQRWPIKPDIVLEGGNAANDGLGAVWLPSLSLLTCHNDLTQRLFTTINATSAATAIACQMAAELKVAYPALWPESVRALMVHSSEWSDAMKKIYLPDERSPNKNDYLYLIRHCGFGVPNLDRALWSMSNSLVMIVETDLQPFQREPQRQPKLKDMNLHKLPWPLEELEALGETEVEMRVTLSYFIEPNPSNRGFKSKYRYESHGLRFDVKRPLESVDDFRSRINRLARLEEERSRHNGDDPNWLIGTQKRHRGSLHSDIWKGNAADLASRGVIAVYPTLGWWKTRTALGRYNNKTRYSLIVSIHAPEVDVDLYTTVQNQIETPVKITS